MAGICEKRVCLALRLERVTYGSFQTVKTDRLPPWNPHIAKKSVVFRSVVLSKWRRGLTHVGQCVMSTFIPQILELDSSLSKRKITTKNDLGAILR